MKKNKIQTKLVINQRLDGTYDWQIILFQGDVQFSFAKISPGFVTTRPTRKAAVEEAKKVVKELGIGRVPWAE